MEEAIPVAVEVRTDVTSQDGVHDSPRDAGTLVDGVLGIIRAIIKVSDGVDQLEKLGLAVMKWLQESQLSITGCCIPGKEGI
jgi:hypothetical protein